MTMQKFDLINTQIMHFILCYQKTVIGINPRTQVRKGLISYYKTNGITFLKNHVDAYHVFLPQMFEEKVNNFLRKTEKIHPSKKKTNPFGGSNSKFFFLSKIPSKKRMCHKKNF
jgi:ribosomal protein L16 Arg81 hydroxylase